MNLIKAYSANMGHRTILMNAGYNSMRVLILLIFELKSRTNNFIGNLELLLRIEEYKIL